jgi:hypothetical protein
MNGTTNEYGTPSSKLSASIGTAVGVRTSVRTTSLPSLQNLPLAIDQLLYGRKWRADQNAPDARSIVFLE